MTDAEKKEGGELKPCPWCYRNNRLMAVQKARFTQIRCGCGASGPKRKFIDSAAIRWNSAYSCIDIVGELSKTLVVANAEIDRLKLAMIEGEKQHLDRELELATRAKEAEDRMMDMQVAHAAELQTLYEGTSEGEGA